MYHDSRDPQYRTPVGPAKCCASITLRLRADEARRAWLRLWWEDKPILQEMVRDESGLFCSEILLPEHPGLLWYYFIAELENQERVYYGNAADQLGGEGNSCAWEPPSYQITVYDPNYDTPDWMRDGVMLQIMVDRYHPSGTPRRENYPASAQLHQRWDEEPLLQLDAAGDNQASDFFGGNLRGIAEKLDYIRSLGVSVLYLNPIFLSPSNHKYDTADYMRIDPAFGTEADFRHLCRRAADLGIRVILDGVFSHTGADSVYFNRFGRYPEPGAYQSKESCYYPWYHFDRWPEAYDAWWGFPMLPNVNEDEPSYREFILGDGGVMDKWLCAGASGWRLDVADELPMDFLRLMRFREKRKYPDAALIGEVWEDPSNKVAYGKLRSYCLGDTLDSTMNYPLRQAIFDFLLGKSDANALKRSLDSMTEKLPLPFLYAQMNLLGSHDRARAVSVLADCGNMEPERRYRYPRALSPEEYLRGRKRFIAAWKLVCALPGMPCLYYGDEAGMTGMTDPFCRGPYPWGREDAYLTEQVREAALLRNRQSVLRRGKMRLYAPHPDVILVERFDDAFDPAAREPRAVLAVHRGDEDVEFYFNERNCRMSSVTAMWLVKPE